MFIQIFQGRKAGPDLWFSAGFSLSRDILNYKNDFTDTPNIIIYVESVQKEKEKKKVDIEEKYRKNSGC